MNRAGFTEERIIGVLKEREAGAKTAELAHKHGVSETIRRLRAKFGGMDLSEPKWLKQLEDESARLENLLAQKNAACFRNSNASIMKIVGHAVAHLQALWACRNDGPAASLARIVRWSEFVRVVRRTRIGASGCAILPMRGAALAIGSCSYYSGAKASARALGGPAGVEQTMFTDPVAGDTIIETSQGYRRDAPSGFEPLALTAQTPSSTMPPPKRACGGNASPSRTTP